MTQPRVSIVIATYNSSHLLRYALASLRLSALEDWEAVVVGDHCTDDSEACVASFGDPRMRFLNLERNSGQQATPNNAGVAAARGEFLCFLNHDDMYLPWHLDAQIANLERTGADIVCCPTAVVPPRQLEAIAEDRILAGANGYSPTGRFQPRTFHVASSWALRRETARQVGPWRLEDRTFVTPSQDWLFRAWRRGKRIHCSHDVSVAVLYCAARRDSYRVRESPEHEFVFENAIRSDRLRSQLLEGAHAAMRGEDLRQERRQRERGLKRRVKRGVDGLLSRLGVHPLTPRMIRRWGGRGGFIRHSKRRTG